MRKEQRNFLALVAFIMVMICIYAAYTMFYSSKNESNGPLEPQQVETQPTQEVEPEKVAEPIKKVFVDVFFIGHNSSREEVYRAVRRPYDKDVDGSKVKFAVNALINGPKTREANKGVYSEIPAGTRVIYIKDLPDKVIINLTSEFAQGGADSLYKRVYQLIKTAKHNTNKPVYLYLDGQKADVLGGEGLMLTQPLNENSLGG